MKKKKLAEKHWADKLAERLIELYPKKKKFVCAAGITPSGIVHIGNFRDLITSQLICKALKAKNKNSELMFFWDDYDRLRKIPLGVPENFKKHIGMPISNVPDPYSCHGSYAEHFEKEFEESMPELGIKAKFVYQEKEYKKNRYYKEIKTALQKREKIAEILSKFKTQGMEEEDLNNYYPLQIYCRKCKKDNTKILSYDGENKITYSCKCGYKESVDISKENIGKLSWKVDWAARWEKYGICFEPGGQDHATLGGSYDVSKEIAEKIYNINPPFFQGYAFIGVRGAAKMSSSAGTGISPKNLLQIYEPELLRWLFTRTNPGRGFTLCFDSELIRQYDEFDNEVKLYLDKKLSEYRRRSLDFTKIKDVEKFRKNRVSFRQVAMFGQVAQGNLRELKNMFQKIGQKFNDRDLKLRLEKSKNWVKNYFPKLEVRVRDNVNKKYFNGLSEEEKEEIIRLEKEIDKNWNLEKLTYLVYEIPKKPGISEEEKKKRQRRFFTNVYQMLIDSDIGPRLPTFLLALGKEKVKKLLKLK